MGKKNKNNKKEETENPVSQHPLQKKWGKDIIVRDKASKRSFDFNPIIKVPIKGI